MRMPHTAQWYTWLAYARSTTEGLRMREVEVARITRSMSSNCRASLRLVLGRGIENLRDVVPLQPLKAFVNHADTTNMLSFGQRL